MKTLIVEDDFTSRIVMQRILAPYGENHIAVNGKEAVEAFSNALSQGVPYHLVCLDVMMPEMDGQTALKEMRAVEAAHDIQAGDGSKIVMVTALKDMKNVTGAFKEFCDAYIVKPVDREKFIAQLRDLGLI
jgi:two-component system, chemotaxis family, chemotaxis protein CheY